MKIQPVNITGVDFSITIYVRTGKFIASQYIFTFCMKVCSVNITGIYLAITIDIAFQMYLRILRHILRTHRDGILPGDMVIFHHLQ